MLDILLKKNIEQFGSEAKEEIKQMVQELDETKDIEESINPPVITKPEVETVVAPNVNPLVEEINKYREIYKDEL
jgi:hypothetical protein